MFLANECLAEIFDTSLGLVEEPFQSDPYLSELIADQPELLVLNSLWPYSSWSSTGSHTQRQTGTRPRLNSVLLLSYFALKLI